MRISRSDNGSTFKMTVHSILIKLVAHFKMEPKATAHDVHSHDEFYYIIYEYKKKTCQHISLFSGIGRPGMVMLKRT